ncbi:ABC transporter ATP binding subunit [Umezakia ovalisporum]|uniref:ABC transporter ATP-binding protein n=1 Tax=Umezakia ovalisporum TaxID=75695 RepID=UPI0006F1ACDF|nr:ABC transporter ATP binding subunit [Umezakia ovalisporum]
MTVLTSHEDTFKQPQDDEVVLSVKNVSKRFCRDLKKSLFYGIQDIAGEVFGARRKDVELRKGEFWALNDVSFELRRGEALGLVGANGAGKTTMLRIISGLIKPDHGSVEIKGRVAPLIALGAGFNPILTGRENVYVNMSILGLSKEEIDERFEDVVEFAEIGEAIDAPVQSYSSGMAARLGFACAIHTEPDILLIDEVLSVGDIRFQAKCHRKLAKLREQGTAFILVSHNPQIILGVCDFGVYLKKGQVIKFGDVHSVLLAYEQDLFTNNSYTQNNGILLKTRTNFDENTGLNIVSLAFRDLQGNLLEHLTSGNPTNMEILCDVDREIKNLVLRINFYEISTDNLPIQFLSNINDQKEIDIFPGRCKIIIHMPYLCFSAGIYDVKIVIRESSLKTLDYIESFRFTIFGNKIMHTCSFYQPRSWEIVNNCY